MGIEYQCEYINEVNWPGKSLKKGYKIEKLFTYIGDEEDKLVRIPGEVILTRNDKKIMASVKQDEDKIGAEESAEPDEYLYKTKWNPDKPDPGAWRQDLQHLMLKIE